MNPLWTLLKKDLKTSLSNPHNIVQSLFMGLLMIFLLSYSFKEMDKSGVEVAAIIFWIASFFSLVILFRDLYKTEVLRIREELLIAKLQPQVIWFGKMVSTLTIFFFIQAIFIGATIMFLNITPKGSPFTFFCMLLLIDLGLVSLASLFGAIPDTLSTDSLLVLILFPLQTPLLLAGIETSLSFFNGIKEIKPWMELVLSCDGIFLGMGLILFPYIYYQH